MKGLFISVIIVLSMTLMLACNQVQSESETTEPPITDEIEQTEETIESSDTITWFADLTHDGNDEKIIVELDPPDFEDDEHYRISVYDSNNNLIWSDDTIYIAHAGNKGYYLYDNNNDGEYYMLYWRPWLGGGSADFEYEIFSFDSTGNKITIESDSFFYNTMQTEQPPIEFKGFITQVNSYLEKSFILIDTYNLELLYSTTDNKIGRLYPVNWDWETSLENLLIQYPTILDETAMFEAGNGISTPIDADGVYVPCGYRFQDLDADNIPEAIIRFGPPASEIMFEKIYKLYDDTYKLISKDYIHTFYRNAEGKLVTAIRTGYFDGALYFVDIQNQQMVFSEYIDSKGNDNYNGIKYDNLLAHNDDNLSITDLDNTLQIIGKIDCSEIVSSARSKVYGD